MSAVAAIVVVDPPAALAALVGAVSLVVLTLWAAHRLSRRLWGRAPRRTLRPSARPLPITVRAWVDSLPGVWPSDSRRLPPARRALPGDRLALEPSRVWTGAEWQRERATLGGEPSPGLTPP